MSRKPTIKEPVTPIDADANKMAELHVSELPVSVAEPVSGKVTTLEDTLVDLSRTLVSVQHDQIRREGVIREIEHVLAIHKKLS